MYCAIKAGGGLGAPVVCLSRLSIYRDGGYPPTTLGTLYITITGPQALPFAQQRLMDHGGLRPASPVPPKACLCLPLTHQPNVLTPTCTHESTPSPLHRTPTLAAANLFPFIANPFTILGHMPAPIPLSTLSFPIRIHTQTHKRLRPKTTTLPHSTTPVFLNSFTSILLLGIYLCWVSVEVPTAFLVGINEFSVKKDGDNGDTHLLPTLATSSSSLNKQCVRAGKQQR